MELTITELLKVELAKKVAEEKAKEDIYKTKREHQKELCFKWRKDLENAFHCVGDDSMFTLEVYDYGKMFADGDVVIKVNMNYGYSAADSLHSKMFILPTDSNTLYVSHYYDLRNKIEYTMQEFVEKLIQFKGFKSSAFKIFVK